MSQKRTGELLDERPPKRRSLRACLSCRARKVRCDVLNSAPCTNCRLDSVACVLKASSRGRKRGDRNTSTNSFLESRASHDTRPTVSITSPRNVSPGRQEVTSPNTELVSLTFEDQISHAASIEPEDHTHNDLDDVDDVPSCPLTPLQHAGGMQQTAVESTSPQRIQGDLYCNIYGRCASHSCDREPVRAGVQSYLPPYIKPLPPRISQRDIHYLSEKDALTIPDDEFRDELLRTYVKIVHCFMPAIDLRELVLPIIENKCNKSISLLLFQAVMFASVIFVDSGFLQSRGFVSRKAARKVFFKRVRLLYGLDCEPDRLALVQALLLMTYWYDSPDDEKDTWYWMGNALTLAHEINLHRDPETLNIGLREKRLRRRIWWSCYIRDRLLALGIHRPTRIREGDYHVSMLELDDFDLDQPTPECIAFMTPSGYTTPEADRRRAVCQICIELAKLCVCIGQILHSQYSVINNSAFSSGVHKHVTIPSQDPGQQLSELARCDAMLDEWHLNQKATCWYNSPSPNPTAHEIKDWARKTTWLHQALLRLVYLTAVGALHRPRALAPSSCSSTGHPEVHAAKKTSMEKVKEAAISMTKLGFDLQSEKYIRFLSTSSVPAFLSAALIHLLDIRDTEEAVRSLAVGRFYQCFHILCELKDMYSSADHAIRFLATVLKKMNTSVPMLGTLRLCATTMMEKNDEFTMIDGHTPSNYENYNFLIPESVSGACDVNSQFAVVQPFTVDFPNEVPQHDLPDLDPGLTFAHFQANTVANSNVQIGDVPVSRALPTQAPIGKPDREILNDMDGLLPALFPFDMGSQGIETSQDMALQSTPW